jgi:hypothetical protein
MGLAVGRSMIEAHNGRLWASPNKPRGAIFQITLPNRIGAIMTKELSQSLKQGIRSDSAILAPSPANAPPDRLSIYPLDITAHAFYGAIAKAGFPS